MKAILEFELPADTDAYRAASDGESWRQALRDFDNLLRTTIKHGEYSNDQRVLLGEVRRQLHQHCDNNNVRLQD